MIAVTPPRNRDMANDNAPVTNTAIVQHITPTGSWHAVARFAGPRRAPAGGSCCIDIGFAPITTVVTTTNRVVVADPTAYRLRVHTVAGTLERIVGRSAIAVPSENAAGEYRRRMIALASDNRHFPAPPGVDSRAWRQRVAESHPFATTLPAFGRVIVDARDNLWVAEYDVERDYPRARAEFAPLSNTTWSVFDSSGVWVTDVVLPARFEVFDIGDGYVAGVWRDEDDVEHVRVYRLTKPA